MPRGGGRGQPTKLTPEVQQRMCQAISAGNYLAAACRYGGVDYTTVRRWMLRGDREPGIYRHFRDAILKAEADAEVTVVALWRSQIPENWAAARDFLARRFPERWGPKARLEHTGEGGQEIRFHVLYGEQGTRPQPDAPDAPDAPDGEASAAEGSG